MDGGGLLASASLDFVHHPHARSLSVSSSSSSHSLGIPHHDFPTNLFHDHRPGSAQSNFSDLESSVPTNNLAHPSLKAAGLGNMPLGPGGPLRHPIRARTSNSGPYSRDADFYSSSSETEDIGLFFSNPSPPDYTTMYLPTATHGGHPHQHAMGAGSIVPGHGHHSQEAFMAAGQFGRMTLGPDHALEQLAANVRAATTTSASDRAKQIFVQAWLNANYAPYPDGNVPRQGLYFSYRRVCDQYGIPHINTATLGKAIRLCFPTIKTRRLGVRGNSKYHYCGIRPTTATEIEWLQDYVRKSNNAAAANANNKNAEGGKGGQGEEHSEEDDEDEGSEGGAGGSAPGSKRNSLTINNGGLKSPTIGFHMDTDKTPTTNTLLSQAQASAAPRTNYHAQATIRRHNLAGDPLHGGSPAPQSQPVPGMSAAAFMGSAPVRPVRALPGFPDIEEALGGADPSSPHGLAAREVWRWFEEHLDALLDAVRGYRFDQFEMCLRGFWGNLQGDHREVVHAPAVAGLMAKADALVYNEILEILRSQMLSHIPPAALSSLRGLADKMEKVLLMALENYGNTFVEPKVELGARFGHLVLRFLDIFQVTQALSTVLTNQKQLADMRRSWHSIDFESVRNQAALVCNCRHEDLVQLLEVDFVQLMNELQKSSEPVGEVMAWADNVCERLMGGGHRQGIHGVEERSTLSSRSILIRWGYVTSQIMRDLTIRSDPAFGAFQILKLFLDDWIALNVLRSVALSTNSVAASVEPVIQQQFFTPGAGMAGQDIFASSAGSSTGVIGDTPTTSSMLAALQDSFGVVDSSSGFDMNSFVDANGSSAQLPSTSGTAHAANAGNGPMFSDFMGGGGGFDVGVGGGMGAFGTHDMGLNDTASVHSQNSEHSGAGSAVHSQHGSPDAGLGSKEEPIP